MKTTGLLLSAGLSSRMSSFKPLLALEGSTLIENSIDSMLRADVYAVTVVLGHRGPDVEALLRRRYPRGLLTLVYNRDYATTDMLASVKIGLEALPSCDAFFLLPGDMPAVGAATFAAVKTAMEKTGARIAFPALQGHRKHPPLIAAACIPDILAFQGQGGLRELWRQYDDIVTAEVDDAGCRIDTDTPADYRSCVQYMEKTRDLRCARQMERDLGKNSRRSDTI